ncbi:hypothetical protein, partial [Paenibacillus dendritiformis]|uniref:hypothetical protein n=1 Tax=Paenibacillus dendritiformis TaxID=130049 RepID=UPI001BCE4773
PESPVPILIFNVQAGNFEGILCSYKGLEKDSKLPLGNTIRGVRTMRLGRTFCPLVGNVEKVRYAESDL